MRSNVPKNGGNYRGICSDAKETFFRWDPVMNKAAGVMARSDPSRLYCADRRDKMEEQSGYAQGRARDETIQTSISADPAGRSVDTKGGRHNG